MNTKTQGLATLTGSTAVIMWGFLALLTTLTEPVPAFQLSAMTFFIATALVVLKWIFSKQNPIDLPRQPIPVWLLGVFSYFAPLISTLVLIAFGRADFTSPVILACILIVGGVLIAAGDLLFRVDSCTVPN